MTTQKLKPSEITRLPKLQVRGELSAKQVAAIADAYRRGETIPLPEVMRVGDTYYLFNGYHRDAGHSQARPGESIECIVTDGTYEDALRAAALSNKELDRSEGTKRNQCKLLFEIDAELSTRDCADLVGCGHNTAAKAKRECPVSVPPDTDRAPGTVKATRTVAGRVQEYKVKTGNIGKAKKKPESKLSSKAMPAIRQPVKTEPITTFNMFHNPKMGAAALVRHFGKPWAAELIRELTLLVSEAA